MRVGRQRSWLGQIGPWAASTWLLLFVLFPLYWMVLTAVRAESAVFTWPPPLLPAGLDWHVAVGALQDTAILSWLKNSMLVASTATVVGVLAAIPGAYAIARFRGRLVRGSALLILVTQTLPPLLLFVPLLVTFRSLGLVDTLQGLILADAAWILPMAAWMLKAVFDGVPIELDEAAAIDGCNRLQILRHIVGPVSLPGLAAVTAYAFIACWDDFLFASTLLTNSALWPASVGLYTLQGEYIVPIQQIMAAAALFTIPPVLLFLLIQRAFVSGLVAGAMKG
jgi:multiple sugar transport system permease protein